eukprot:EG_transcript_61948
MGEEFVSGFCGQLRQSRENMADHFWFGGHSPSPPTALDPGAPMGRARKPQPPLPIFPGPRFSGQNCFQRLLVLLNIVPPHRLHRALWLGRGDCDRAVSRNP